MKRRDFLKAVGFGATALALSCHTDTIQMTTSAERKKKPNIVYILADDLGYACLLYTSPSPRDRS